MKDKPFLNLLNRLWAELQQPDLVWQLLALALCLGIAWLVAEWWQQRERGKTDRLRAAGARLAFPLTAALLVAVTGDLLENLLPHVQLLAVALPLLVALAVVRVSVYVLRQSFRKSAWLAAFERWVAAVVWIGLALYISDLAPTVIGVLDRLAISLGSSKVSLWILLKGSLTVAATLILALWIAGLVEARLMKNENLDSSLRMVAVRVTKALLTLVALMSALSLVGIDVTALSVFTGALGVGLGFGLQKIASNYVAGFIILLDRSIRLGNVIQVGSDAGKVTEITTRYTVLKNLNGVEFIVPNETLIGATVQNQSYSDSLIAVNLAVGVAYDSDLDAVMRMMEAAARAHPRVLAEPAPKAALVKFGDSAIEMEVGFWVNDPELGLKGVRSDVALAVWRAFSAAGVVVPVPQREVRILGGKLVEGA